MDKEQKKLIWLELFESGELNSADTADSYYIPCRDIVCSICKYDDICGHSSPRLTKEELDELLEEYPELKVII